MQTTDATRSDVLEAGDDAWVNERVARSEAKLKKALWKQARVFFVCWLIMTAGILGLYAR